MNIYELKKYAKDKAVNTPSEQVKFTFKNPAGVEFEGEWLDPFFGLILIPSISSDRFISISQITQLLGEDTEFTIKT